MAPVSAPVTSRRTGLAAVRIGIMSLCGGYRAHARCMFSKVLVILCGPPHTSFLVDFMIVMRRLGVFVNAIFCHDSMVLRVVNNVHSEITTIYFTSSGKERGPTGPVPGSYRRSFATCPAVCTARAIMAITAKAFASSPTTVRQVLPWHTVTWLLFEESCICNSFLD